MSDETALLAAIRTQPGEDTPRLAYADEVEAADPARAEFIRVQVELARLDAELADSDEGKTAPEGFWKLERRESLRRRERGLYAANGLRWAGDWQSELAGSLEETCTFHRGFVAEVRLTCAAFTELAESLFRIHPVERVVLTDLAPTGPVEHGPQIGWYFYPRRDVPEELWEELEFDRKGVAAVFAVYMTRDKATEAMNIACVRLGRKKAGLPGIFLGRQASNKAGRQVLTTPTAPEQNHLQGGGHV